MPGNRILYIVHPSLSHINASKKLLKILSNRDCKVTLCTNSQGKVHVKELPYEVIFVDSMPFASGFEEEMQLGLERGRYYETLLLKKSYHFYKHRSNAYDHILDRVKPNVILVDILYSTDIIFLHDWSRENNCKVIYIRTKVNPLFDLCAPPMNLTYSGKNRLINAFLWRWFSARKRIRDVLNFIKYQGFDDRSVLLKSLARTNNLKAHLRWYRCVGSQFENIPELVLLPQEFEMPHFLAKPTSKYIGFQYDEPKNPIELEGDIRDIVQNGLSNNHRIIYISFGSLYGRYRNKIKSLLQKIILALKEEEKVTCIVSLEDARSLLELPENIFAFDFVNQFAVLKYADLFITHGGINAVKEAVAQKVPMLVYPLNRKWDQPGNSARIQRLGLGLKGSIYRDSPKNIRKKIRKLLSDETFRENICVLSRSEENYTEDIAYASLLEIGAMKDPVNKSIPTSS